MAGIVSYGVYVPRYRLAREAVTVPPALGVGAPTGGTRAVAGFDEDSTSMGVEASRAALTGTSIVPDALYFATANPAYLDKTNATTIHAALDLPGRTVAMDMLGSIRSGAGALRLGLQRSGSALVILSDVRAGLPGSADEREGGDAAAAFVLANSNTSVLADLIGAACVTEEFLDRWRLPTESVSRRWEERFGQEVYQRLGQQALEAALEQAGVSAQDVQHLIVAGASVRAAKSLPKLAGVKTAAVVDDLIAVVGNTGAAHPGLMLAATLDRASAGDVIVLLTLADGAEALVLRATEHLAGARRAAQAINAVKDGGIPINYTTYLDWRGLITTAKPRRPEPADPPAPSTLRNAQWKLRFTGSRCAKCGEPHFPPQRICLRCGAADQMESIRPATGQGTVVTAVVDSLAWSAYPPVTFAVADLDGGGRVQCEVAEAQGIELSPGSRVEITFRRMFTTRSGIHNYFWKLRPIAVGRAG